MRLPVDKTAKTQWASYVAEALAGRTDDLTSEELEALRVHFYSGMVACAAVLHHYRNEPIVLIAFHDELQAFVQHELALAQQRMKRLEVEALERLHREP